MDTYADEMQSLLKGALSLLIGVTVWEGVVDEAAALPAVSWHNIGYGNGRTLDGDKINDTMSFRVVVVADSSSDLNEAINAIGLLDNTSNTDFQRIEVVGNRLEAKVTGVKTRRYMMDLNLTV